MDIDVKPEKTFEGLSPDALFSMALRVNKKRQFLFVSKLIAKHLAVHPALALGTGTLLASLLMENEGLGAHPKANEIAGMIEQGTPSRKLILESLAYRKALPQKALFIGMAETATGLGHSVFQHFSEAAYIHTTREEVEDAIPSFVFEEEHSHATSHKVFAPPGMLEEAETIVLIDDEISTGNTLINLISALDDQYPGKNYKALSILDWRTAEQRQKMKLLAAERGLQVDIMALMNGQFELHYSESPNDSEMGYLNGLSDVSLNRAAETRALPIQSVTGQRYFTYTGRFGLSSSEQEEIRKWAENTAGSVGKSEKPLVLGIGENMYLPLRFALELGGDPLVQTTTRSPIFASDTADYPIKEKVKFKLPDAEEVDQFIYNVSKLDIDRIYLLAESVADPESWQPLIAYLEKKAPVEWISLTAAEKE